MRFIKTLYIIKYISFEIITDYFTHIKTLKKRIVFINVILIFDKQIILALFMSLFEHFQYLIKIWDITLDMTIAKIKNMFLKEKRKGEKPKNPKKKETQRGIAFITQNAMINATIIKNEAEKPSCKTCDRIHELMCWTKRLDLIPN